MKTNTISFGLLLALNISVSSVSVSSVVGAETIEAPVTLHLDNLNGPELILDKATGAKGRVYFVGSAEDNGWSGLTISVNQRYTPAGGHVSDDSNKKQQMLTFENHWKPYQNDPDTFFYELNYTAGGFRLFNSVVTTKVESGVENVKSLALNLVSNVLISRQQGDPTPSGPILDIQEIRGVGDRAQIRVWNVNASDNCRSSCILLKGGDSTPSDTVNWMIGTDRYTNKGKNFFIFDMVAAKDRFFIDPSGKIGVGTTTPQKKLDVDGDIAIGNGAATWTQGTGAPMVIEPNGSMYSRTSNDANSGLYVMENGIWVKK